MTEAAAGPAPDEALKRQVFLALAAAQDGGVDAREARRAVASRFGLTDEQVRAIEQEGVQGGWPPLDD